VRRFTRKNPAWLDLGCGHHIFGWWMATEEAEAAAEAKLVIGMDHEVSSLRKHEVIPHRLAGDIARLPFPDKAFDLVTANMVLEHLEDVDASLREIRRVLKPGGAFVFHTPNYGSLWVFLSSLSPSFLKVALARLFEGRASADVFPTHYRMNTPQAVNEHATQSGFEIQNLSFLSTSALTAVLGPLSVFELLLLRILEHPRLGRFRSDAIGVLRKPAVFSAAGSSFSTPVSGSLNR
jgi:ubiquinone/menaquinone biosynthesis C-methylase UbiE